MANEKCPSCGASYAMVGRVHRCISVAEAAGAEIESGTYRYRDADARRAYMRDYMRKRRNGELQREVG